MNTREERYESLKKRFAAYPDMPADKFAAIVQQYPLPSSKVIVVLTAPSRDLMQKRAADAVCQGHEILEVQNLDTGMYFDINLKVTFEPNPDRREETS